MKYIIYFFLPLVAYGIEINSGLNSKFTEHITFPNENFGILYLKNSRINFNLFSQYGKSITNKTLNFFEEERCKAIALDNDKFAIIVQQSFGSGRNSYWELSARIYDTDGNRIGTQRIIRKNGLLASIHFQPYRIDSEKFLVLTHAFFKSQIEFIVVSQNKVFPPKRHQLTSAYKSVIKEFDKDKIIVFVNDIDSDMNIRNKFQIFTKLGDKVSEPVQINSGFYDESIYKVFADWNVVKSDNGFIFIRKGIKNKIFYQKIDKNGNLIGSTVSTNIEADPADLRNIWFWEGNYFLSLYGESSSKTHILNKDLGITKTTEIRTLSEPNSRGVSNCVYVSSYNLHLERYKLDENLTPVQIPEDEPLTFENILNSALDFMDKYKVYFIIGGCLIGLGIIGGVVNKKRRSSSQSAQSAQV